MKRRAKKEQIFCSSWKSIMWKLSVGFLFSLFLALTLKPGISLALIDYSQIPDNTWVLVDQGTDASLDPPSGILAYSGMAIDSKHQKLLLFGGGHNDYSGNEVWAWDINKQTWQKMYESDPLYNINLGVCKASVDNVNFPGMWLPSGRPITRHTYDSVEFIEHAGVMIAGGYSTYSGTDGYLWSDTGNPDGCYLNGPKDTWIYNLETNQWTYKGSARTDSSKWSPGVTAYDSNTGLLIAAGESGTIWLYDINTNTWTQKFPQNRPALSGESVMTYDSKRNLAYVYGGSYPPSNELWAYSVTNNNWTLIQPQGTLPPLGGGYGTVYDSVNDVVIIFGNDGLWVYDPNLNKWEKNPGNPLLAPNNTFVVHGSFKYDPVNNVSFLVNGNSRYITDVWVYRYKKASSILDTIPPSTPTNFQAQAVSSSQINLSWSASTDNVGVRGYKIYRGGTQIATSATNSYSDIGLSPSTTYSYTISAYDAAGNESSQSTPISITTQTETVDITSGLVGFWKFDEGAGTTAGDSSGNNNTGTLTNSPTWTAGKVGGALSFDGVDDYVSIPDNLIKNGVILTVAAWIKTSTSGVIIGYQNTAHPTNPSEWVPAIYVGADGKLRGEFWQGAVNPIISNSIINDGMWHHVALSGNTNTQSLYLDGTLAGTLPGNINQLSMSKNQIGLGYTSSWPSGNGGWFGFNGSVDEVRIYNRTLSATEIQTPDLSKPNFLKNILAKV